MSILRLWVDPDWPEKHTALSWWLFDDRGQLVREGHSEPGHWPESDTSGEARACELILAGDQGILLRTQLPTGKAGQRPEVIAFALEERLLETPENYHLHLVHQSGDASLIAAIPRRRLDYLLPALTALGCHVVSIRLAAQLLPEGKETILALCPDGSGVLRSGGDYATVQKVDGSTLPWEIAHAQATLPEELPMRILAPAARQGEASSWLNTLIPSPQITPIDPAHLSPPPCASRANLCSGAYAPPTRLGLGNLGCWRGLARAAVTLLILIFVLILSDWGWQNWQARQLRKMRDALFIATWPQAGPPVAPLLQAKRQIDASRHTQGHPGHADLLTLLGTLGDLPNLKLGDTLRYSDGKLDAEIITSDHSSLERSLAHLRARGVEAVITSSESTASGLRARLSLHP